MAHNNFQSFLGTEKIGIVVKDLKRSMALCSDKYGMAPWQVYEFSPKNVSDIHIHGRKKGYSILLGVCQVGNMQLEFVEPLSESIYTEHSEKHGQPSIHDIKLSVSNYEQAIKHFESKGIKQLQSGNWEGKCPFSYMDTEEDLGFRTELAFPAKDFIVPKPDYEYPPNASGSFQRIFTGVEKIGIVVKDLKRSMALCSDKYGMAPWQVYEFSPKNVSDIYIHGRKKGYSILLGVCQVGNMQLEFVEPLSESIYTEHSEKHGQPSIHDIKLSVSNYEQAIKHFESKGIKQLQSGNWEGKCPFAYMDTEDDLGFRTELAFPAIDFVVPKPDYVFP